MKKKKRKISKKSGKAPEAMPEAAFNISPDDVEIGDDLTAIDIKKQRNKNNKEDH
ncbi:MAG: hypothetical protein ACOC2J_00180 [bacterium]